MGRQCCQCGRFEPDTAVKSQCVGHCEHYDVDCSGYSESGYSEFYPQGRECPGFFQGTK